MQQQFQKKILKFHGSVFMIVAFLFTINAILGVQGIGIFDFLKNNQIAFIGIFEAYVLAIILGLVLLLGSRYEGVRQWNFVGALIHVPLLTLGIVYWDLFVSMGFKGPVMFSFVLHSFFIILETTAFLRK